MTLAEVVKRVARQYGASTTLAGGFIYAAFEEIVKVLDSGEEVHIRGLGTLKWVPVPGRHRSGAWKSQAWKGPIPPGIKLKFKPNRRFRSRRTKMSDNEGMLKYGVELDQEKTKEAGEGSGEIGRCPTCNRELDGAGACPVHGTEPLEPTGPAR